MYKYLDCAEEDMKIHFSPLEDMNGNHSLSSTISNHTHVLSAMANGQEDPNKAAYHYCLYPRDIKSENEMNEDIKPVVVPPTLREFYEFIHELNDRCQINLTPREIIALVSNVECNITPSNCEQSFCALDLKSQVIVTKNSLHSIQQVELGLREDVVKCDVCPKNLPEKPRKRSTSRSSPLQNAHSRCVLVKPKLSRLVIKLTSREHLAFKHYNKAARCIENVNRCLSTRNLKVFLSSKKSRLTVKGSCDFGRFKMCVLKLIRLAVRWWDRRNDEKTSKSSFQDVKPDSDKQAAKFGKSQNPEKLLKTSDIIRGTAPAPKKLLAKQCTNACKDFPDCCNTLSDQATSRSCYVAYICKYGQHHLFIRADQQFDIVKKLNFSFVGVKISLLRKFAAFHLLPAEGVNPQFAINAISELKSRCLSIDDIHEVLQDLKQKRVNNYDSTLRPKEAMESSSNNQQLSSTTSQLFLKRDKAELRSGKNSKASSYSIEENQSVKATKPPIKIYPELKILQKKPKKNLNNKCSRELYEQRLATTLKMKNRERSRRRRQTRRRLLRHSSRNQDRARESGSSQRNHHTQDGPEYCLSYSNDSNGGVGSSQSLNYTIPSLYLDTWQQKWPCLQWEPAPMQCILSVQF